MNKKVILVLVIVLLIIGVFVAIAMKQKPKEELKQGEDVIEVNSSSEDNIIIEDKIENRIAEKGVPERFIEITKKIIEAEYASLEDIKPIEELDNEFGLDEIGVHEGVLIKKDSKDDFFEIALIVPDDKSFNDSLLVKMITRYESIKSDKPDLDYLRNSDYLSIKQQGGVSIFIVSKDNSEIYELINNSNY